MNQTLIFLHGGPGFQDYLEPYFTGLSSNFDCIFYDQLRGPQIKIEDLILQLDQRVNSIQGKKILVGHSWGAVLAVEYARRHQEKLSGLVMLCTGLNSDHWGKEYRNELEMLGLTNAGPEKIYLAQHEEHIGIPFLDKVGTTLSEETFASLTPYLRSYDLTLFLNTIHLPILNIFGENDLRFPTRITRTFRKFNSNMLDLEIPKVGHFPFLSENGRARVYAGINATFKSK